MRSSSPDAPWHAEKSDVHHTHPKCITGKKVTRQNRRPGTGGKPLCRSCAELNRRGRSAAALAFLRAG